jgi:hypothetical protein
MATPQGEWSVWHDHILLSLMHVHEHGVRSRGSRSWKDITATIKEPVVACGLGFDIEYTAIDVQVRWVEVLRNYCEHVDNNAAEKTQLDNKGADTLAPPLKENYKHELKSKR